MYLSLYWKVRELIRMDVNLIKLFLAKLKETSTDSTNINTSFQYGVLSIFSNLTKQEIPMTKNQIQTLEIV